eukprot:GHUV01047929.1.p1 GENE.GHUV01047929.1~~GHUV01047929.1.p1  ORF type:complete len:142 (-),score=44.13 GHUV01047929.1:250-675(-)
MQQDNCIIVDANDKVTGSANKYDSHRFIAGQPQGLLHRAFSVFLFNSEGELLLQQRAASKITFPGAPAGFCWYVTRMLINSATAVLAHGWHLSVSPRQALAVVPVSSHGQVVHVLQHCLECTISVLQMSPAPCGFCMPSAA